MGLELRLQQAVGAERPGSSAPGAVAAAAGSN